jgi:hypothetical protein
MRLRGRGAGQAQDAALLGGVGFQAQLVRVLQGVALVEVELVVGAGGQGLAQRAVRGEREVSEQMRQSKLLRLLGSGIQNGLGGRRYQKKRAPGLGR